MVVTNELRHGMCVVCTAMYRADVEQPGTDGFPTVLPALEFREIQTHVADSQGAGALVAVVRSCGNPRPRKQ